jgi:hypothetical protein
MGGSLSQLTSRQLERLKSELAEVIIANFCYPAFLDYRLNTLRTRPVDRRKRQEVWAYVSSVNFNPLASMDVASMDFRRFVERVFLRYIDMNRALIATASARQAAAARARVPLLAVSVARGLADYLVLSEASTFGQARLVESWGATSDGVREPSWEQIEKSTQVLQTTLVYLRAAGPERVAAPTGGAAGAPLGDLSLADYPTRVLAPGNAEQRPTSVEATNGTSTAYHHSASDHEPANGAHPVIEELAVFPNLLPGDESGLRGQFRGPRRSPTSSRPVDRPSASRPLLPSEAAPIEPQETISRPIQPPETWSRPIQPPPVQPPEMPSQPIQPPPAPQPSPLPPPAPAPEPEAAPDIWQSLLMRGAAEPPEAGSSSPAPSAPPDQPDLDFLDLPESFAGPRLLELPPDLAELYGDYLRDSRSASLDVTASEPNAAEAPFPSSSAPLPQSETDEEVDALFTALTSHIAAQQKALAEQENAMAAADHSERANLPQQFTGPQTPGDTHTSEPAAPTQSGAPDSQEAPAIPHASASLASRREEQQAPAAPAKGLTDGDVMIFAQLQHQISTWVKMAAVSHQIDLAGRDAAELVVELRRMAALEEAELQVIESLVALCSRVTLTKQATMDDYKQAMMLYLLHHRSRLAL